MKHIKQVEARPTKYVLKYGKTLKEIAKIFGVSLATIHNWNKVPAKKTWMEEILKKYFIKE